MTIWFTYMAKYFVIIICKSKLIVLTVLLFFTSADRIISN